MKSDWRYLSLKFLGQIFEKSEGVKLSLREYILTIHVGVCYKSYKSAQNASIVLTEVFLISGAGIHSQ